MSRVLAFSCCHAPCMLPGYPDFLADARRAWKPKIVICLGDVLDSRCLGRWDSATDPDLPNANVEYEEAKRQVAVLHKMFPNIDVLIGNHDTRRSVAAKQAGLIQQELRAMKEVWATPRWRWHPRYTQFVIDDVIYQHGDRGRQGQNAAYLNAMAEFRSVVQGHIHTRMFVQYAANSGTRVFGMQVGCGVDRHRAEMAYCIPTNGKPIIGCGIIIDGRYGYVEPMDMGVYG